MKGIYSTTTILDFGMYKGYELGIVYVFDPSYVDWCINNISKFFISDLEILKDINVVNENLEWQYRSIGDPSLISDIDRFVTLKELIENVDLGNNKYIFKKETLQLNRNKSFQYSYNPINSRSDYESIKIEPIDNDIDYNYSNDEFYTKYWIEIIEWENKILEKYSFFSIFNDLSRKEYEQQNNIFRDKIHKEMLSNLLLTDSYIQELERYYLCNLLRDINVEFEGYKVRQKSNFNMQNTFTNEDLKNNKFTYGDKFEDFSQNEKDTINFAFEGEIDLYLRWRENQ